MIPFTTSPAQKVRVCEIAVQMKAAGLEDSFIAGVVDMASEYEGTYDLMELWASLEDPAEKSEIIADLQEEIDSFIEKPKKPTKKPYISFSDLEGIGKDVLKFKKELRDRVDQWGGISKLAKATGIPQPSLSRFFNSATMPRRTTLYKIADAIGLSEKDIVSDWVQ
jgi:preprotein translocase subunit Sss1